MKKWIDESIKYIIILVVALSIGSILIIIRGESPFAIASIIVRGIFTRAGIANTLRYATPVIITGLATAIAMRANIGNIGVEGQLYVGALVSAVLAYTLTGISPLPLKVLSILGGMCAGALYAMIPALLLVYLGVNEILTTLMLNYVAIFGTEYLVRTFLMGGSTSNVPLQIATPAILPGAKLSVIMPPYDVTSALVIGILLCIITFMVYKYTKYGYILNTFGANKKFAFYGGVKINRIALLVFALSGFIGAFGGISEVLGVQGKFINNFSAGIGWDGILVSLIAKNNPIGVIFSGILWGFIKNSGFIAEQSTNVDRWTFYLIQAVIVLLVTADLYGMQIHNKLFGKRRKDDL